MEKRIRRELRHLLPEAGFLGEETDPASLDNDWLWVVDPIDGTSNFSRGLPQFSVSVALLHRGQPVLAAIHCYPEDAGYTALHRQGAWRNGRRLTTPRARFDDGAIVGCQWFRGQTDMSFLPALQSRGARIRTLGSTVVQIADCVAGRLDANVQQQGRLWDFAAAGLVAVEAGLRFHQLVRSPRLSAPRPPRRAHRHDAALVPMCTDRSSSCSLPTPLDGRGPALLFPLRNAEPLPVGPR